MEEIWDEFEDGFFVSNYGRVRSPLGHYLKPNMRGGRPYIQYRIHGEQVIRSLAMLVAESFIKMPVAGCKRVTHKDGDKWNNRADNLEWFVRKTRI